MAHDVFISYAQHDKPTADAVCHGLESVGIRCWMAPRDLPAATIPQGGIGARAGALSPSGIRGWAVGLAALAAVVLVAAALALRHWIGNEDTGFVLAIAAGVFFLARGRKRR